MRIADEGAALNEGVNEDVRLTSVMVSMSCCGGRAAIRGMNVLMFLCFCICFRNWTLMAGMDETLGFTGKDSSAR